MLAQVKVLIQGKSGEYTYPTISLVRDNNIALIVDPGIVQSTDILYSKLKEDNLNSDDINYVLITHSHFDHYKNVGMFPKAKVIEYFGIWENEKLENREENLTENLKILFTPGHDYTSITLFVKTDIGTVAVCGDVFWYEMGPEIDAYAQDLKKLEQSRKMVIDMADFIIPGHGAMFKVNKLKIANKNNKNLANKLNNKNNNICKKCKRKFVKKEDQCACQNLLCYRCCECDIDCAICNCKHKNYKKH